MLIHRLISLSLAMLVIVGCSSIPPFSQGTLKPPRPQMDEATVKLAEAASSVSDSLVEMARIESANSPVNARILTTPDIPGMSELVSVDWSGPIGPLVEKLAIASGYKIRVLGKPPAIPVLVSVTATNIPLSTVLRDLDFQASKKARIFAYPNVDPSRRFIELRYAG